MELEKAGKERRYCSWCIGCVAVSVIQISIAGTYNNITMNILNKESQHSIKINVCLYIEYKEQAGVMFILMNIYISYSR